MCEKCGKEPYALDFSDLQVKGSKTPVTQAEVNAQITLCLSLVANQLANSHLSLEVLKLIEMVDPEWHNELMDAKAKGLIP